MKLLFRSPWLPLTVISTFMIALLLTLFQRDASGNWVIGSYSLWGDWSAHLTFINGFRERGFRWILGSNPLFADTPFQYPFLSHWFTAGFASLFNLDSIHAMIYTAAVLLAALPFLVYLFFRSFALEVRPSLMATLAWLMMGGLQIFDSTLRSDRAVTNQFESGSVLTSFLLFEWIPQRAFLFGGVVFLTAFILLLRCPGRLLRWTGMGLIVILPLLHFHSWIAAGVLYLALAVFPVTGSVHFETRKSTFRTGGIIAVLSGIITLLILSRPSKFHLSWDLWAPGWAQSPDTGLTRAASMNPLWFWIYNTGLFLPLVFWGIISSRTNPKLRALWISGLALFISGMLFRIQPYFYDNLKIFTYAFLFFAPFFGTTLQRFSGRLLPIALILLFLQCASTARDARFLASGGERTTWFSSREISIAEQFKEIRKSPSDLVFTSSSHHHWVPCLTGNPIFMGYPGWLWSWGISYSYREKEVFEIWAGRPQALELIRNHGIRYIVFDRNETIMTHRPNEAFFDQHFKKVLDRDGWVIYSVETKSPS